MRRQFYPLMLLSMTLLLVMGLSLFWQNDTALSAPPPLPTMTPTPEPQVAVSVPPVRGGSIELHAQFPSAWPWTEIHWQEPWTVVQWQDKQEAWRDVTGWQGTLDEVQLDEDGMVTGIKRWWVAEDDLGTGPFRWVVYTPRGEKLLATSEPFMMPGGNSRIRVITVFLSE